MRKLWLLLLLVLNSSLLPAADDSLVLNLKLDEGKGDQAIDSSGRNHNAKLINVEWVEFGVEGKAVQLSGNKSYIDLGKHEDFNFTQDFTMSLWMKVGKFEGKGLSLFVRGNYQLGWQTYVYKSFIAMSSRALKGDMVYRRGFAAGTSVSYPLHKLSSPARRSTIRAPPSAFMWTVNPGKPLQSKDSCRWPTRSLSAISLPLKEPISMES
jgi:hypothetical protein